MSQTQDLNEVLIAEYLGDDCSIGGPFALLGLRHDPLTDEMILQACRTRLARINLHRGANTPAADEVRLAVHAAASQLLDPALREELKKVWPEGIPDAVPRSPEVWNQAGQTQLDENLKRQALMLIGACGGWNARARKRLGQFARVHQVSATQLIATISGDLDSTTYGSQSSQGSLSREVVRGLSLINPADDALPWQMIPVAYGFIGALLIWFGFFYATDHDTRSAQSSDASAEVTESAATPSSTGERERSARRHYTSILHELEQFARTGIQNEQAALEFAQTGQRLCEQWVEFGNEDLKFAAESVQRVLSGILNDELFDQSAAFLVDSSQQEQDVIRTALRHWLSGDLHLPPKFATLLEVQDQTAIVDSIQVAYQSIASSATDDPNWWSWWVAQLKPMYEMNAIEAESVMLSAVYGRMQTPLTADDRDSWERSSQLIVQHLNWSSDRVGKDTRAWLMGAITDPSVRSDRLSVLTQSLVLHSSAGNLNLEMIIQPDDSMEQRSVYLETLRKQWHGRFIGEDGESRDRLIEMVSVLLRETANPTTPSQSFTRTIKLARMNQVCKMWFDDHAAAVMLMDIVNDPLNLEGEDTKRFDLSSSANDAQWATSARNETDPDALMQLLDILRGTDRVGPKSAHALVYLAMQGPDTNVRDRAISVMLSIPDDPAILIALDRMLTNDRTTQRMRSVIINYIGADSVVSDELIIRRILLEKLASTGVVFDTGSGAQVRAFESSYRKIRSVDPDSEQLDWVRSGYDDLVTQFQKRGEGVPSPILVRLHIRLGGAQSGFERAVAFRYAELEIKAHDVQSNRPAQSRRVDSIIRAVHHLEKNITTSSQQLSLIERAILEIWLIQVDSGGVS